MLLGENKGFLNRESEGSRSDRECAWAREEADRRTELEKRQTELWAHLFPPLLTSSEMVACG